MKFENIELQKIVKTDIETKEGGKTIFVATFENKDEGTKIIISQDEKFDLVLGEEYSIKLDTEQKTL